MQRLWVLAMLVLVPLASASERDVGFYNPTDTPTPTTMYFHINDIQHAPINTQRPDDRFHSAPDIGLAQHSQGCIEVPGAGLLSGARHTYYGFSSPGYVNYDIDMGGKPLYHNERGISFDVDLADTPVRFYWYLETQLTTADHDPNPNQVPVVLPQVVVRATLREGDDVSVGATAYNQGAVIAQGQTEPVVLAGPLTDAPDVTYIQHHDRHLYEFAFELPVSRTTILQAESFNARVDIFQANGVCEDVHEGEYVMADLARIHTSAQYRPRFIWDVMNPLRIESLHPMAIGDDLVIHASVNSPWGNYDVLGDDTDLGARPALAIDGPSIPVGLELVAHTALFRGHHQHTEAVALAWSWPYIAEHARPGVYRVEMEVANDQETARAFAVAEFQIGTDGRAGQVTGCGFNGQDGCVTEEVTKPVTPSKGTPGLGTALVAAALALAARRRA